MYNNNIIIINFTESPSSSRSSPQQQQQQRRQQRQQPRRFPSPVIAPLRRIYYISVYIYIYTFGNCHTTTRSKFYGNTKILIKLVLYRHTAEQPTRNNNNRYGRYIYILLFSPPSIITIYMRILYYTLTPVICCCEYITAGAPHCHGYARLIIIIIYSILHNSDAPS